MKAIVNRLLSAGIFTWFCLALAVVAVVMGFLLGGKD